MFYKTKSGHSYKIIYGTSGLLILSPKWSGSLTDNTTLYFRIGSFPFPRFTPTINYYVEVCDIALRLFNDYGIYPKTLLHNRMVEMIDLKTRCEEDDLELFKQLEFILNHQNLFIFYENKTVRPLDYYSLLSYG